MDDDYRLQMEFPMESLAIKLNSLGFKGERLSDAQIVEIATNKLQILRNMLVAAGVSEEIVKAVMSE